MGSPTIIALHRRLFFPPFVQRFLETTHACTRASDTYEVKHAPCVKKWWYLSAVLPPYPRALQERHAQGLRHPVHPRQRLQPKLKFLQGARANLAGRGVDDASKADRVPWIHQHAQIRHRVLDLLALVKRRSAGATAAGEREKSWRIKNKSNNEERRVASGDPSRGDQSLS